MSAAHIFGFVEYGRAVQRGKGANLEIALRISAPKALLM
jgi:hypothetical protein